MASPAGLQSLSLHPKAAVWSWVITRQFSRQKNGTPLYRILRPSAFTSAIWCSTEMRLPWTIRIRTWKFRNSWFKGSKDNVALLMWAYWLDWCVLTMQNKTALIWDLCTLVIIYHVHVFFNHTAHYVGQVVNTAPCSMKKAFHPYWHEKLFPYPGGTSSMFSKIMAWKFQPPNLLIRI